MTKHKKQHYIPQCYLQAWCDSECLPEHTPYVWRFVIDGGEVKKKAPENIFYEKDMYTIHFEDGTRNLVLEQGLNQLETLFVKARNEKIQKRKNLTFKDRIILCAFAAAMQARTKSHREHQRKQWKRPLEMMESMREQMKKSTPEERKRIASFSPASRSNGPSFTYEDVKSFVETPMQKFLMPMIHAATPLLCKLNLAIFTTQSKVGFITSDAPCVWFDPEAYKRPPMLRAPALIYKTIEITLPISPHSLLFLNRQGIKGYHAVNDDIVDDVNRRTRCYAAEYFVVNSNFKKEIWFDPGTEPKEKSTP